jgi:hypothetical protein
MVVHGFFQRAHRIEKTRRKSRELTQPEDVSVWPFQRSPTILLTRNDDIVSQQRNDHRATAKDDGTGQYDVCEELNTSSATTRLARNC